MRSGHSKNEAFQVKLKLRGLLKEYLMQNLLKDFQSRKAGVKVISRAEWLESRSFLWQGRMGAR